MSQIWNHVDLVEQHATPVVGMGATVLSYTDRNAYTIVAVPSRCRMILQRDTATRTDDNGMSESQTYEFSRNPEAPTIVCRFGRKNGWRTPDGRKVLVGVREQYRDFSF